MDKENSHQEVSVDVIANAVLTIEEQISESLVKANVTDAIIAGLKEKYLPMVITDKESYLEVKAGRKEVKSIRVLAEKICKKGREEANATVKAWVAKQKEVSDKIGEVEEHLEKQEKEYEAKEAADKAERERKQQERLIIRQQELTKMGVLYSDGEYSLGGVSYDLNTIKDCEDNIWEENIFPKFKAEYEKNEADRIEAERERKEQEAELERQRQELQRQQQELLDQQNKLKEAQEEQARKQKEEEDRKKKEVEAQLQAKKSARVAQLTALGLKFDFSDNYFKGYDCFVHTLDITGYSDEKWEEEITRKMTAHVNRYKEELATREKLQHARLQELAPYNKYGEPIDMDNLWSYDDHTYNAILEKKKSEYQNEIEKQKKSEADKVLRESRRSTLQQYGVWHTELDLAEYTDEAWQQLLTTSKEKWEQAQKEKWEKEQEEKRKKEEAEREAAFEQAKDKEKWEMIIAQVNSIEVYHMRSHQYRTKTAKAKQLIEQIKSL